MRETLLRQMDRLLKPRGVAVVGASQNPSYVTSILRNVAAYGFQGGVYAVNPGYDSIGKLPCYPSLLDIAEVVDHVVVGVPDRLVPEILADCERKGVGAVTIITSGYGETDDAGGQKQADLRAFSQRTGIRIVGPNCLGLLSTPGKMNAMPYAFADLKCGPVAFVLQSGAMGACTVFPCLDRGIGVNYCVTSGNEADLETPDYIRYFVDDPETRVIGCFTEQARSVEKLIEVCELAAEARKPIVMLKIGRTEASRRSARAHTGALVGSHQTFEAFARRHGILLVRTIDELVETMAALLSRKLPRGNRLGAILLSGGAAGLLSDLAPDCGVAFPPLLETTAERLRPILPVFGSVGNPLDTTAMAFYWPGVWDGVVDAVSEAENLDVVLFVRGHPTKIDAGSATIKTLQRAADAHPEKVFLVVTIVGGKMHEQQNPNTPALEPTAEFDGAPILAGGADDVLRAVAGLIRYGEFQRQREARRANGAVGPRLAPASAAGEARRAVEAAEGRPLTEREGKALLRLYGIPTTVDRLATTAEEAVETARAIGYPVVLKVEAPEITHKTEAGGVRLGLDSDEAVAEAFEAILAGARRHAPGAAIAGVLVQEQIGRGQEIILGASHDVHYGPTVLCGLGGVLVEVLKDTALRLPPIGTAEARGMLDELRGRALLDGVRGAAPADVEALIDALRRFAELTLDLGDLIEGIDVNPLIVFGRGEGVKALDCLIVPKVRVGVAGTNLTDARP